MEQFEIPPYIKGVIKDQNKFLTYTIRKRINNMVSRSLFVLDYFAGTDRLQFDKVWHDKTVTLTSFLRKLTSPNPSSPPSEEQDKFAIAGELIKIGLEYYDQAFKNTKILKSKIKEFQDLVGQLNEITRLERTEQRYSRLYRLRKKNPLPPNLINAGGDNEYRAYCVLCFRWNHNKDRNLSMTGIRHHKDCYYNKNYPQLTACTLEPRKKR
jgi:hypothetical protein